jgi:hypothetical protein
MLREDPSGRFDYLFEPLDVDESAGNGDDAVTQALEQPADENRWSRRIILTGVVLATLAVAAATVVVLLQPTRPAQLVFTPSDSTPPSATVPTVMSTAMPTRTAQPVPVLPTTISTPAIKTSAATPRVEPATPTGTRADHRCQRAARTDAASAQHACADQCFTRIAPAFS